MGVGKEDIWSMVGTDRTVNRKNVKVGVSQPCSLTMLPIVSHVITPCNTSHEWLSVCYVLKNGLALATEKPSKAYAPTCSLK